MPFPALIDPAVASALVNQLAALFLTATDGDTDTARHVATKMLQSHNPQNDDELAVAAEIVGLGFRSMDALCRSAGADLADKGQSQLIGRAIGLNREAHKSRRALAALRRDPPAAPAEPAPQEAAPATQKAAEFIERACEAIQAAAVSPGKLSAQDLRKRHLVQQMQANSRKAQEKHQAAQAALARAA